MRNHQNDLPQILKKKNYNNKTIDLTFTSIRSTSTHMISPLRLTFLASQKRSSLASTTDEQPPVFKSEKKILELAITTQFQ